MISENRNFLFELNCFQNFEFINKILIHVINFTISTILVYNIIIAFICLLRNVKFETLFEYKQDDVFLITFANASFIIENVKS